MEPIFLVQDATINWQLAIRGQTQQVSIKESDGAYSFNFLRGCSVYKIFFTSFNDGTDTLEGRYTLTRVDREKNSGPKGMVEFKANPEKSIFTGGPTNFNCMPQWTLTKVDRQAQDDDEPKAASKRPGCIIS